MLITNIIFYKRIYITFSLEKKYDESMQIKGAFINILVLIKYFKKVIKYDSCIFITYL